MSAGVGWGTPREVPEQAWRLTSVSASSRAWAWLGKNAAPPNFTSTTSADSLSTTFLLRMEAAVSERLHMRVGLVWCSQLGQ